MKKNILVLGASGMLGNAVFRLLATDEKFNAKGTVRSFKSVHFFEPNIRSGLIPGPDIESFDGVLRLFEEAKPDVVINCIGLVKQLSVAEDPLAALPINSILPHRLARLCALSGARFIHMSTDCVFSGSKGGYIETDFPDAKDLYGRSKFLGEVDYPNAITLRTSIIGHELDGCRSLIGWFLAQSNEVRGYTKAIFSGLPTFEIARVIRDFVIPNQSLHGLYHVSAKPISKFDLLTLVAKVYDKQIKILPDNEVLIDRSLDSSRFQAATGYTPPSWPDLVQLMHDFH